MLRTRLRLAVAATTALGLGAAVAAVVDPGGRRTGGGPSGGAVSAGKPIEAPPREAVAATRPPPAAADRPLRVMLDPGHGGSNLGAPSIRPGVSEKHVTLALALALRRELRARGVEVLMTRERDEYVSLRERVRRANAADVDRFVSLHANATDNHAQRGFESWILSPRSLDVDGRALRQGAGDGPPRPGVDPAIAPLLDDVERGAALPASAALAARVQAALRARRGAAADRGVFQGSQDVLLGATMPAVLVEVGFVDHAVEGEDLLRPAVRDDLAAALATAIASP